MINISRTDKMSIYIKFDKVGLDELYNAFKKVYMNKSCINIIVMFDKAVINMKKANIVNETIKINHIERGCTEFVRQDEQIIWNIEKEDIESAISQFESCIELGYFYPAEFIRVQVLKNKKLDYIYCEMQ